MSKTNITRSVVLEKETWEWLDAHAKQEGRSASAQLRTIIADYRHRWGQEPAAPISIQSVLLPTPLQPISKEAP
jgi:hypothetical protein